ncbi:hypothetical protein [Vibrio owensii]|uniref:hypothetical protein n=1 Tax=Vibrio TaxID=662 RepID=UPI0022DD1B15|nr:hypothetical protein [Vibrio owensii]MDA0385573.1 hypothetical protein [Vibrio owensii]
MPRERKARSDADIATIEENIEEVYGLPEGSVVITNPDGSNARGDKHIGTLRDDYDND